MASFLVEVADRLAGSGCSIDEHKPSRRHLLLPFSRQQIADVLGLTIETVSRQFTRLKNEGIIDLPSRRDVRILDYEALAAEAG